MNIVSDSFEFTLALGRRLATALSAGDVVGLTGELGAGKTMLIKGICAGLGVTDAVTSPTFTLIQEYFGTIPVYHFDFYRLENVSDIEDLGLDMYFDSEGVCLIEWAERGENLLPPDSIRIRIERIEDHEKDPDEVRRFRIQMPPGRQFDLSPAISEKTMSDEAACR